jgi:hypothetical protein
VLHEASRVDGFVAHRNRVIEINSVDFASEHDNPIPV